MDEFREPACPCNFGLPAFGAVTLFMLRLLHHLSQGATPESTLVSILTASWFWIAARKRGLGRVKRKSHRSTEQPALRREKHTSHPRGVVQTEQVERGQLFPAQRWLCNRRALGKNARDATRCLATGESVAPAPSRRSEMAARGWRDSTLSAGTIERTCVDSTQPRVQAQRLVHQATIFRGTISVSK